MRARDEQADGGAVPVPDHGGDERGGDHPAARARSTFAAVLIFVQTLLILGVVALLEQHPLPGGRNDGE